jgi:RNA polymerase sigma factor (sigma-70 family)
LQEACVRALRGIKTFAGGSARAWTLTIVRRTAYTWLGKNRPPMIVALDDLGAHERAVIERGGEFCSASKETPETELIAKADAKQLEFAIASLPPEFRETLILRDIHGLGYREIAEVTETPVGTVMSRLARARQRLIAALVEHEK